MFKRMCCNLFSLKRFRLAVGMSSPILISSILLKGFVSMAVYIGIQVPSACVVLSVLSVLRCPIQANSFLESEAAKDRVVLLGCTEKSVLFKCRDVPNDDLSMSC